MKKIMYLFYLLFLLIGVSCTKKFNEINQSIRGLPSTDFPTETYLPSMIRWVYPDNGDGYGDHYAQTAYNLTVDVFAGHFGPNWSTNNPSTYLLNLSWNGSLFNIWSKAMGLFTIIQTNFDDKKRSLDTTILGMSLVVKVLFSQAVADYYGVLPYTSFGSLQAIYDPLDTIYNRFFQELDLALSYLDSNKETTTGINNTVDLFYAGNQKQWVKLVNSLRMRIAMRIVKVDGASRSKRM
ncbi:MAG: SusD/RagB family nutrient-binding outer membrane lipoprotein [Chitinophagaceae bacterium]